MQSRKRFPLRTRKVCVARNSMRAWVDELAKWRQAEATFNVLQFGLRLGEHPQQVITTTPRPIALLKRLMADPSTVLTRAGTRANARHLSPSFLDHVLERYAGTRFGRQEIEGEIVEDRPDALWSRGLLETCRVKDAPPLARIVVAVDPPASSSKRADACGLVAAGRTADGAIYVLADETVAGLSPAGWAAKAIALWRRLEADALVVEVNQGGDMVRAVIAEADRTVPVVAVRASRGKWVRAEPVAALYEQGRVKHVGVFPALEDEMCDFGLRRALVRPLARPGRCAGLGRCIALVRCQRRTAGEGALTVRQLRVALAAGPGLPCGPGARREDWRMSEDLTAEEVRALLKLEPHPTCGFVRISYVSSLPIAPGGLPAPFAAGRPAGSALYFMVTPQAPVHLHRIRNDQLYHHYLGDPIDVIMLHVDGTTRARDGRLRSAPRRARAAPDPGQHVSHRADCRTAALVSRCQHRVAWCRAGRRRDRRSRCARREVSGRGGRYARDRGVCQRLSTPLNSFM